MALLLDVLAVVGFVLIGRASHGEDETVGGLLRTLWPFLAGLVVGWLWWAWRDAARSRPSTRIAAGLVVGPVTAVVGLALRAVSGQGVAVSFLVVALIVLTVFVAGWRAVWALVCRGFCGRAVADLR